MWYRILVWPVVGFVITGGIHFAVEAIWPDLKDFFVPAVVAPLLIAYGIWVGYRTIGLGGTYVHAIAAGAILGVLPILLEVFGFGVILGRGIQVGVLGGIFNFSMVVFGSLFGSGFALSREQAAQP